MMKKFMQNISRSKSVGKFILIVYYIVNLPRSLLKFSQFMQNVSTYVGLKVTVDLFS